LFVVQVTYLKLIKDLDMPKQLNLRYARNRGWVTVPQSINLTAERLFGSRVRLNPVITLSALITPFLLLGCSPSSPSTEAARGDTNANQLVSAKTATKQPAEVKLLNVSYDPTREFYQEFNTSFAAHWQEKTGVSVSVDQSHGGSGKQARAVIDGLQADVVTLALSLDIDAIAEKGKLLETDWQSRLPNNSAPYTSTIVFVVRKGNPKNIRDWGDLVKGDVEIITANPKTGGGARWNYLAAWGFALHRELGDLNLIKSEPTSDEIKAAQSAAKQFVAEIYKRVPVLDSAARGSTNTFVQREIGDVLLTWENEAILSVSEGGKDKFEVIVPSISILAEPPVAVVDKVASKHGVADVSKGYLEYLYTPVGQTLAAKHHYRPALEELVDGKLLESFPKVNLFKIDDAFGGWAKAQKEHFIDGGVFDQIYESK